MSVCCECCVLSGRGLCDELITRPEESYRLWGVVVCDLETSRMRKPWPAFGRSAQLITDRQVCACVYIYIYIYIYAYMYRGKVKWSRYRPGVTQRVGRGIALLFHDRDTGRGWVVSTTPRPHFTLGKEPVPILQKSGWAPGPVWAGGKSRPHRDFFYWSLIRYNVYNSKSCHLHIPPILSHDSKSGNPFWLPNVIVCSNLRSPFASPPTCSLGLSRYLSLTSVLYPSSQGIDSGDAFLTSIYGYGYGYLIRIRSRNVQPVVSRYTDWATRHTHTHI